MCTALARTHRIKPYARQGMNSPDTTPTFADPDSDEVQASLSVADMSVPLRDQLVDAATEAMPLATQLPPCT